MYQLARIDFEIFRNFAGLWPWWEYLQPGNWHTLQIRAFLSSPPPWRASCHTFASTPLALMFPPVLRNGMEVPWALGFSLCSHQPVVLHSLACPSTGYSSSNIGLAVQIALRNLQTCLSKLGISTWTSQSHLKFNLFQVKHLIP